MAENHSSKLDALIEEVLTDESLRPLPTGFHRRFEERLHITSLVQEEHQRMRIGFGMGAALFGMLTVVLLFAPRDLLCEGMDDPKRPGRYGVLRLCVGLLVSGAGCSRRISAPNRRHCRRFGPGGGRGVTHSVACRTKPLAAAPIPSLAFAPKRCILGLCNSMDKGIARPGEPTCRTAAAGRGGNGTLPPANAFCRNMLRDTVRRENGPSHTGAFLL